MLWHGVFVVGGVIENHGKKMVFHDILVATRVACPLKSHGELDWSADHVVR